MAGPALAGQLSDEPARGDASMRAPGRGTGFYTLAEKIGNSKFAVIGSHMWIKFTASEQENVAGGMRIYAAVCIPDIFHLPGSGEASFEVKASRSGGNIDAATGSRQGTGPMDMTTTSQSTILDEEEVPVERCDAQVVMENYTTNQLLLRKGGWLPGTNKAGRHVSLLYMNFHGDATFLKSRLETVLKRIVDKGDNYEIEFEPIRDQDVVYEPRWKSRTAMLGVVPESAFDREVLQILRGEIMLCLAAHQVLGGPPPTELFLPTAHVTFW